MIDFRYHIVSIAAVFLALGIGVALGATVLDRVTVGALEARLDDLRTNLDDARADITGLQDDLDHTRSVLSGLAPHATDQALQDRSFLVVNGRAPQDWEADARQALADAGAVDAGTISFTERWADPEAIAGLVEVFTDLGLEPPEPGAGVSLAVPRLLGATIQDATGRALLAELETAGFVRTTGRTQGETWPDPATDIVIFTGSEGEDARIGPLAAFGQGTSSIAPTLAACGDLEDQGAVALLRDEGGLPTQMATFDSSAEDTKGSGVVLALRAAIDGRGGHFGSDEGLSYFPLPT